MNGRTAIVGGWIVKNDQGHDLIRQYPQVFPLQVYVAEQKKYPDREIKKFDQYRLRTLLYGPRYNHMTYFQSTCDIHVKSLNKSLDLVNTAQTPTWHNIRFNLSIANHLGENKTAAACFEAVTSPLEDPSCQQTVFFQTYVDHDNRHAFSLTDRYTFKQTEHMQYAIPCPSALVQADHRQTGDRCGSKPILCIRENHHCLVQN